MENKVYQDEKLNINILCSFFVIFASIFYFNIRFNIDSTLEILRQIFSVAGVSFLLLNGSYILNKYNHIKNSLFKSDAVITFLLLIFIVIYSFLLKNFNFPFYIFPVLFGFFVFVCSFIDFYKRNTKISIGLKISSVFLFSFVLYTSVWSNNHIPLQFESLFTKSYKQDSFYFIALMNMLGSFNFLSNGIDGLIHPFYYHVTGLFSLADIAALLKIPNILFFPSSMVLMLLPLYFKTLLSLAIDYRLLRNYENIKLSLSHYFLFVFFIIGIIPVIKIAGININYIQSVLIDAHKLPLCSSHTISLILTFLMFSSIFNTISLYKNQKLSKTDINTLLFIIMPVFAVLITGCKVSGFVMFIPVILYAIIRLKKISLKSILFLLLIFCAFYLTYKTVTYSGTDEHAKHVLFAYFKTYTLIPMFHSETFNFIIFAVLFGLYFIALNIYSILYSVYRIKQEQITSLKDFFSTNKLIDVEMLGLLVIMGMIPGELNISNLGLVGGNGYYFNSLQYYLLIPLFLGVLNIDFKKILLEFKQGINTKNAFMFITVLYIAVVFVINLTAMQGNVHRNQKLIKSIKKEALQNKKENTQKYMLFNGMHELSNNLSKEEKKETAVYIPQKNELYWSSFDLAAQIYPFVAISLTELPVIRAVTRNKTDLLCQKSPEGSCNKDKSKYLYYSYSRVDVEEKDIKYNNNEEFCKLNEKYGFKNYFVINQNVKNVEFNKIVCK